MAFAASSYALCQTACNGVVVACYASAGYVFGAVTAGAGVPAAVASCSTTQGACMSACAAKFLTEAAAETVVTGWLLPAIVLGGLAARVMFSSREEPDGGPPGSENSCDSSKSLLNCIRDNLFNRVKLDMTRWNKSKQAFKEDKRNSSMEHVPNVDSDLISKIFDHKSLE